MVSDEMKEFVAGVKELLKIHKCVKDDEKRLVESALERFFDRFSPRPETPICPQYTLACGLSDNPLQPPLMPRETYPDGVPVKK